MLRIVTKVSGRQLNSKTCSELFPLYKTLKIYEFRAYKNTDVCPPKPAAKGKRESTGTIYTIGIFALGIGGAIGYAKYDPEFRRWLGDTVPYSEDAMKLIFQEEKSFGEALWDGWSRLKTMTWQAVVTEKKPESDTDSTPVKIFARKKQDDVEIDSNYQRPTQVLTPIVKDEEENYSEIRRVKEECKEEIEVVKPKPPPENLESLPDHHPKRLAELEERTGLLVQSAIESYDKACSALINYSHEIDHMMAETSQRLRDSDWAAMAEKSTAKSLTASKAEITAAEAKRFVGRLKKSLKHKDLVMADDVLNKLKREADRLEEDLEAARLAYEAERDLANVTERYWQEVRLARETFRKELEVLAPGINLDERNMKLDQQDVDLFVVHTAGKVFAYQKALVKLQTLFEERLERIRSSGDEGGAKRIAADLDLEKERLRLEEEYAKKCMKIEKDSDCNKRDQLKTQLAAHSDHMKDALDNQRMELEREFRKSLNEKVSAERENYKTQLAKMVARLKGMDNALKARASADQTARKAQALWSACMALIKSVQAGRIPGEHWCRQLKPLKTEIDAIKKAADEADEFVNKIVAGIPEVALERGVYPEDALRERFLRVEEVASKLALVPETGGRLPVYLLSYLQSMLLIKSVNRIPQSELSNEQTDFDKLNTYDVLQRARYWLDRGDFAQALKYMNLLKGASKSVAKDWIEETKVLLETQQAANILMAHAAASGLAYLDAPSAAESGGK